MSYIFSIKYSLKFQAGLVAIEVGFKVEHPDDKPEPLEMEHFYFPLGLWLAGLVVSVICLLAEIIVNYIRKRSNKEETNSTPVLDVEQICEDIEDNKT